MDNNIENLTTLVKKIKEGDNKAFEEFYNLTQKMIYNHAYKILNSHHDACDVVQNVFLKFYMKKDTISDNSKVLSWLMTTAKNECLLKFRERNLETNYLEFYFNREIMALENTNPVENNFDKEFDVQQIKSLVNQLSSNHRQIITMYYFENMKLEDIAETLNVPESTVKSRFKKAKEELRNLIIKYEHDNNIVLLPAMSGMFLDLYSDNDVDDDGNDISQSSHAISTFATITSMIAIASVMNNKKISNQEKVGVIHKLKLTVVILSLLIVGMNAFLLFDSIMEKKNNKYLPKDNCVLFYSEEWKPVNELSLLPDFPESTQKYYVMYSSGYYNGRVELAIFDVAEDQPAVVNWYKNNPYDSLQIGKYNGGMKNCIKYYFEQGIGWVEFERFKDNANSINSVSSADFIIYQSNIEIKVIEEDKENG